MYIKHSKYKNTGILFEVIVRKITSDTLSGKDSAAIRKQKYNLISELKEHYNVADLFKTKLTDYKAHASLYTLVETYNTDKLINPNQIIDNKVTLLEFLTESTIERDEIKNDVIEEFKSYDKDLRTLTYYVLLEKFNDKYSSLSLRQKHILKEFIESVDNAPQLKDFYNKEVAFIIENIKLETKKTKSEVVKIKLNEVLTLIKELDKKTIISSDHLVDLLQYHSLLQELNVAHG